MKRIPVTLIALLAFAASACEIPFELDDISEPAIFVQYLPGAGMEQKVKIAYAEPAFGETGKKKYDFQISDVDIKVNGVKASLEEKAEDNEEAWNRHILTVTPGTPIKPGDEIALSVTGRGGVADVSASTVIPQAPKIVSLVANIVEQDSSEVCKLVLKLDHEVQEGEYIGIKAKSRTTYYTTKVPYNPAAEFLPVPGFPIGGDMQVDTSVVVTYFSPGHLASTADINSLDLDNYASVNFSDGFISAGLFSGEPMMLFTARQFDGDSYTFYANTLDSFSFDDFDFDVDFEDIEVPEDGEMADAEEEEDIDYPETMTITIGDHVEFAVEVYRLSDEFYNYAKAQYLMSFNMLSNFGVTPPNFTYSNIVGGLGVVAGLSCTDSGWIELPEPEEAK